MCSTFFSAGYKRQSKKAPKSIALQLFRCQQNIAWLLPLRHKKQRPSYKVGKSSLKKPSILWISSFSSFDTDKSMFLWKKNHFSFLLSWVQRQQVLSGVCGGGGGGKGGGGMVINSRGGERRRARTNKSPLMASATTHRRRRIRKEKKLLGRLSLSHLGFANLYPTRQHSW